MHVVTHPAVLGALSFGLVEAVLCRFSVVLALCCAGVISDLTALLRARMVLNAPGFDRKCSSSKQSPSVVIQRLLRAPHETILRYGWRRLAVHSRSCSLEKL